MDPSREVRRGRPPMEMAPNEPENELSNRRLRMRLAQRAYRNRKMMAFDHEKARSERLSIALDKAIGAFSRFHRRIVESDQQHSPEFHAHLDKVAKEMAAVVQDAGEDAISLGHLAKPSLNPDQHSLQNWPSTLQPQHDTDPNQFPVFRQDMVSIFLRTRNPGQGSLQTRFMMACIERTIFLLSKHDNQQDRFPALILPLQLLGEELLKSSTLGYLSAFGVNTRETQYPPFAVAHLPKLYRVIEGDNKVVPRLKTPFVQKLQFGKTRTKLRTDDPRLQGEWLEALDVEEYLQQRGIDFRNIGSKMTMDMENHDVSSTAGMMRSQIASSWQIVTSREPDQGGGDSSWMRIPPDSQIHEISDFSVFGIRTDGPPSVPVDLSMRGVAPDNMMTTLGPGFQTYYTPNSSPKRIIIDIDQLIYTLGTHAICLGSMPGIRRESVDYAIRQSVTKVEEAGQTA